MIQTKMELSSLIQERRNLFGRWKRGRVYFYAQAKYSNRSNVRTNLIMTYSSNQCPFVVDFHVN